MLNSLFVDEMFARAEKLLLLLILLQVLLHYSVFDYYFGDEGYYLTWAWLTNRGELIYRDTFHMYSPGPTFLLAFFFKIFGERLAAARILVTLVEVAITVTIFTLAKKIFGEKEALIASAVFVICEIPLWGSWMLAEPFMTLSVTASALFLYMYYFDTKELRALFISGALLGLSVIFKQTGIYVFPVFLFYVILQNKKNYAHLKKDFSMFSLGFLVPSLLVALFFLLLGALPAMINNIIVFNLLTHAQELISPMTLLQLPIVALILTPAVYVLTSKNGKPELIFLLTWLFAGFFDAFPTAFWAYHYFPALPPAVILIGYALRDFLGEATSIVRSRSAIPFENFRKALLVELLVVSIICVGWPSFFLPFVYKGSTLESVSAISSYVRSNTNESDKILVFPISIGIYFFSEREPASYYSVFCCGMSDDRPEIVDKIISDIEKNKPKYIVVFDSQLFILHFVNRSRVLSNYISQRYYEEKKFYLPECECEFKIMRINSTPQNAT